MRDTPTKAITESASARCEERATQNHLGSTLGDVDRIVAALGPEWSACEQVLATFHQTDGRMFFLERLPENRVRMIGYVPNSGPSWWPAVTVDLTLGDSNLIEELRDFFADHAAEVSRERW
jgi:hypothetical protein